MKTTIKLKNPIKVDGKTVSELKIDTEVFSLEELERANKKLAEKGKAMSIQETDFDYHLIVARILIEKTSKGKIAYEDLARVKGSDLFQLQRAGRDFLLESVAEEATENTEEQSEPIAESTQEQDQ